MYLPHPHIVFIYFSALLHTVSLLAHHQLLIYHSSVNLLNCNYVATMAYLLPAYLTPFTHTVYRLFFLIVFLTVRLFIQCVVVCVTLLCFILAMSQL
jgi:hypothetical protein